MIKEKELLLQIYDRIDKAMLSLSDIPFMYVDGELTEIMLFLEYKRNQIFEKIKQVNRKIEDAEL